LTQFVANKEITKNKNIFHKICTKCKNIKTGNYFVVKLSYFTADSSKYHGQAVKYDGNRF
jgi:hypothetical protein